jgi:hypothetical protein
LWLIDCVQEDQASIACVQQGEEKGAHGKPNSCPLSAFIDFCVMQHGEECFHKREGVSDTEKQEHNEK